MRHRSDVIAPEKSYEVNCDGSGDINCIRAIKTTPKSDHATIFSYQSRISVCDFFQNQSGNSGVLDIFVCQGGGVSSKITSTDPEIMPNFTVKVSP